MNPLSPNLEPFYQMIGQAALDYAPDIAGRLLLFADVEDRAISVDIFYLNQAGSVRLRFASRPTQDLIYSFWDEWRKTPGNQAWRTMSYVIDGGKFDVDFTYPGQMSPKDDPEEMRDTVLEKYFRGLKVDYSNPR